MRRYFTTENKIDEHEIVSAIKQWSYTLHSKADLQPLYDRIGNARIVMLGEASHGTHEYYTWRTHVSKKLIEEKGFNCIAVEGDWPDCYQLNRYVKGYDVENKSVFNLLHTFNRWPTWMWSNWEVMALAEWLKRFNKELPANKRAGFYGLDVYSLWESMESIMRYLEKRDPATMRLAEEAYHCFEPYGIAEGQGYARASRFVPELCSNEVTQLLKGIQENLPRYDGDFENAFNIEQNALVAVGAERYYRAMIKGGPHSWNVRDRHMADTLNRLLKLHGDDSKIIVWAHNTHVGDARATDMITEGMYNIGELARTGHRETNVVLVGFGSFKGTVIAARSWNGAIKETLLPEAPPSTWEYLLHEANPANKLMIMDDFSHNDVMMENHIGHRAVGVVYNPQIEQYGNYVPTILPLRYDAFIFIDDTSALHPLHMEPDGRQMPETYPFGV